MSLPVYQFVTVYDWYNTSHSTRVRCQVVHGNLYISYRQYCDAIRRVGLLAGSVLRADSGEEIHVFRPDGTVCGWIARH